jgi:hypothetical protein
VKGITGHKVSNSTPKRKKMGKRASQVTSMVNLETEGTPVEGGIKAMRSSSSFPVLP